MYKDKGGPRETKRDLVRQGGEGDTPSLTGPVCF